MIVCLSFYFYHSYADVETVPSKMTRSALGPIKIPEGYVMNCMPQAPTESISGFEDSACGKIVHCKIKVACYLGPDPTDPKMAKQKDEGKYEHIPSFETVAICRALGQGTYCPDATKCALDFSVTFKNMGHDPNTRWYRPDGTYIPQEGSK